MKFVKSNFLVFVALSALLLPNVANADCLLASAPGYYCNIASLAPCPAGCYCTGGSKSRFFSALSIPLSDFCAGKKIPDENTLQNMKDAHVYICPEAFPLSSLNAKALDDCWRCNGRLVGNTCPSGKMVYSTDPIECEKGEYLPKGKAECEVCDYITTSEMKVKPHCPGGTFKFSLSKDQGNGKLSEFNTTSATFTTSVTLYVTCDKGKYLPANSLVCEPCQNGHICPKTGNYTQKNKDQGLETCPGDRTPNQNKTECVPRNNNNTNTNNNETNSGNSNKNNSNTNNNETNSGNSSNNDKTCPSILSKNQLKYGANGDKECWLFLDMKPEKYKKCVCGE